MQKWFQPSVFDGWNHFLLLHSTFMQVYFLKFIFFFYALKKRVNMLVSKVIYALVNFLWNEMKKEGVSPIYMSEEG
ncbi:hypothetical protein BLX87_13760 [Bacillus sp. VT-16-64]|nr:hypothetical protein BLX87_13760 [Bacillus sp. VT-16-64]